jgi:hypothetical protein
VRAPDGNAEPVRLCGACCVGSGCGGHRWGTACCIHVADEEDEPAAAEEDSDDDDLPLGAVAKMPADAALVEQVGSRLHHCITGWLL